MFWASTGGRPFRADGHDDGITVDDGRYDERGNVGLVHHVDGDAAGLRFGADMGVLVLVGGIDEGGTIKLAGHKCLGNVVDAGISGQFRMQIACHHFNDGVGLEQKADLAGRFLTAAHDQHAAALQVHEDREVAHL
jgi:hypothetical protein